MTISSKTKKILAISSVSVLGILCAISMVKCSSNGGERDEAQDSLVVETARADSLQNVLEQTRANRDAWRKEAKACADTIKMLRRDGSTLCDSIWVLNDSIDTLNAQKDSLQNALNDCRAARRVKKTTRRNNSGAAANNGGAAHSNNAANNGANNGAAQNVNNNSNVITVPAPGTTNVNVNGGSNNTVNVNNGTVNNYYNAPKSDGTVKIKSSASATTTYIVTRTR